MPASVVLEVVRSSGSNVYRVVASDPASVSLRCSMTWSNPSYTFRSICLPAELTDSSRPNGSYVYAADVAPVAAVSSRLRSYVNVVEAPAMVWAMTLLFASWMYVSVPAPAPVLVTVATRSSGSNVYVAVVATSAPWSSAFIFDAASWVRLPFRS